LFKYCLKQSSIDNVDKKIDTLSKEFKNLVEKIAELTGAIKNEKDEEE
ncbi:1733_t:CDS:2, partial [Racocetra fulgida]